MPPLVGGVRGLPFSNYYHPGPPRGSSQCGPFSQLSTTKQQNAVDAEHGGHIPLQQLSLIVSTEYLFTYDFFWGWGVARVEKGFEGHDLQLSDRYRHSAHHDEY